MDNKQITVDELIDAYQKEMSVLSHNKIMTALQIEKMANYITQLEKEKVELTESVNELRSKISSTRKVKSTVE